MPIYEYRCTKCEKVTELVSVKVTDEKPDCSQCGSPEVERIPSRTSFKLVGAGFHVNDYPGR